MIIAALLVLTSPTADEVADGTGISLYPARPNPFSGSTTIDFFLPRPQHVKLGVYDVRGRKVLTRKIVVLK